MEQNQNQGQQQQQFKCTGDCFSCRAINERKTQWQYCAAQHAYNAMRMIQSMQESINTMAGTIEELRAKVKAIQDSDAMVFDPNAESMAIEEDVVVQPASQPNDDTAQEGSGAI